MAAVSTASDARERPRRGGFCGYNRAGHRANHSVEAKAARYMPARPHVLTEDPEAPEERTERTVVPWRRQTHLAEAPHASQVMPIVASS
jgi:hypothetical protein